MSGSNMFSWLKRKKKEADPSFQIKMDSIATKEAVARKILGEERRKEERRFEGHDRRLRLA